MLNFLNFAFAISALALIFFQTRQSWQEAQLGLRWHFLQQVQQCFSEKRWSGSWNCLRYKSWEGCCDCHCRHGFRHQPGFSPECNIRYQGQTGCPAYAQAQFQYEVEGRHWSLPLNRVSSQVLCWPFFHRLIIPIYHMGLIQCHFIQSLFFTLILLLCCKEPWCGDWRTFLQENKKTHNMMKNPPRCNSFSLFQNDSLEGFSCFPLYHAVQGEHISNRLRYAFGSNSAKWLLRKWMV